MALVSLQSGKLAMRILALVALICAGMPWGTKMAVAQDGYARPPLDSKQFLRKFRAESRTHQQLEAEGFRYVGTDGHAPFVYYVYRREADRKEYHCGQNGWKTGLCHPNVQRDANVLPRHVRIADLKRAGYRYDGLRVADGRAEHLYTKSCGQLSYLCPNEGFAGCRSVRTAAAC